MVRKEYVPELEKMLGEDEIVVRTLDGLGFLVQNGYKGRMIADAGIYTFNGASREFLFVSGVCMDTVPLELNHKEIAERGTASSELIIYGHVPMMISAQCVYKNTKNRCRGRESEKHVFILKDRMSKKLPVICFCGCCLNVIYNSVPLSLHSHMDKIRKLGIENVRLYFTVEEPEEALSITGYYTELINGNGDAGVSPVKEYTNGHFIKGVE